MRITCPEYVGLTKSEAVRRINSEGNTYRIVREDGEKFPIITDVRLDRVNLEIDKGIVTAAYLS